MRIGPRGLNSYRADSVDSAVRRRIELVELRIHPVDRSPDFVDYWQNLTFRPSDQR